MSNIWQDLVYAARMLARNMSFTAIATLMLALGIGANAAIFSVVQTVLIRPLPYRETDRIAWLSNRNPDLGVNGAFLNPADILDLRDQSQSFESIAAWGTFPFNLYGGKTQERVEAIYVTPNFFHTLGIQPTLGRDFAAANEAENSVIISHALWLRQFGGDQNVIGRKISFGLPASDSNNSSVIVGVLPQESNFPARVDVFTMSEIDRADLSRGGSHNWRTIGRLRPGVTLERAQAELNTLTQRQEELFPDTNKGWQIQVQPLRDYLFGNSRAALLLLFGAVGMVLLIACANIANLQLGRIYSRRREFALRLALGAGRLRILRQFLIENLLLSSLGCGLGVVVAIGCLSVVRTLGPESIPRLREAALSLPAFAFTIGVSVLTATLFGVLPALNGSQWQLSDALKAQSFGTTPRRSNRIRRGLVVSQIALALILLSGAGLVIKSFWRLQAVNPGMKTDHLITAGLSLSLADYPNGSPRRLQVFKESLERLQNLPGVTAVGAISHLPLGGRTMQLPFLLKGQQGSGSADERVADYRVVTPSFFKAAGIELRKGRDFDERDRHGTPQVFVVNEAFARVFLSGRDPIGVRLEGESDLVKGEIIGVVASVKHKGLELEAEPAFYVSSEQSSTFPIMNFVVRTQTDPEALLVPIQRELQSVDSRGVVFNVRPFEKFVGDAVAPRRFNLWLFSAFGFLALVLVATGVYAMINFAVVQRRREIGIRIALGAQKNSVMKLMFGEGAILISFGLVIGLLVSLLLTHWMQALLFGVSATDPRTYLIMTGVIVAVGFLACWIPVRQATRVDPISVLRCD